MSLGLLVDVRQFWVGFSWHSEGRRLIVMLLPGLGFVVDFNPRSPTFGNDY